MVDKVPSCKLLISTEVMRLLSRVEPLADENREDPQCGRMMHKELRARLVGDILNRLFKIRAGS